MKTPSPNQVTTKGYSNEVPYPMSEKIQAVPGEPPVPGKAATASGRGKSKRLIITGILLLCLLGAALWFGMRPDPVISRLVLIVDDAGPMHESFGAMTKVEGVKNAITEELSGDVSEQSLSLRIAGGEAGSDNYSAPVVPFTSRNQQAVVGAMDWAESLAKGSILQEMKGALADLTTGAGASGSKKTVLLFAGSNDICKQDVYDSTIEIVRNGGDAINWKLIGLELDQDCRERVQELRSWLDLAFPRNQQELQWFTHDGLSGNSFRNLEPEIWIETTDEEVEISAGETFGTTVRGRDPNGSELVFEIVDPPENAQLRAKGPNHAEFVWPTTEGQAGDYVVAITAFDGQSATAAVLHITVTAPLEKRSVNRPPTLDARNGQYSYSVTVGETLRFTLVGRDPDGTVPSITLAEPPPGASLKEDGTGASLFNWTPTSEQVGTHLLTFAALDNEYTISRDIAVTVNEPAHQVNFDYPDLVLFDLDSHELTEAGKQRLLNFVAELKGCQKIVGITITGHTCSLGSEKYNLELGRERAVVVRTFLEQAGISSKLIRVESMGEKFPLADNTTPEGREQNRRVHCVGDVFR